MAKWFKRSALIIIIIFILMNVVAYFHAYKFTHFSETITYKTSDAKKLSFGQKIKTIFLGVDNPRPFNKIKPEGKYETIQLASNKRIECWHIKNNLAKGTVILFHGYSGEKSSMLDKAKIFQQMGYSIMLVDFMGSGGSEGNQTTIGFAEAEEVKSAFDYLQKSGEKRIILFGTSMGAVAIMKALSDYHLNAKAIIVECPFGTMLETVQARFKTMNVPSFPMADLLVFWGGVQNGFNAFEHNPVEYASEINVPTLLLYGKIDDKVSEVEIDSIASRLKGRKSVRKYPLAGHENYLNKYKVEWSNDVLLFLEENANPIE